MELPTIVHPTTFKIRDVLIGVISYIPLTDSQAKQIALLAYRSRKWKKSDQGKLHQQMWTGDEEALAQLEALLSRR